MRTPLLILSILMAGCSTLGEVAQVEAQIKDAVCDFSTERQRQSVGVGEVSCR